MFFYFSARTNSLKYCGAPTFDLMSCNTPLGCCIESFKSVLWKTKKLTPKGVSFLWWGRTDSNHRSETQQIYSLSPLATRELPHMQFSVQWACLEPVDGLEPPTCWLQISCSTNWAIPAAQTEHAYYNDVHPKCQVLFCLFSKNDAIYFIFAK